MKIETFYHIKSITFIFCFMLMAFRSTGQTKINPELKKELDSILRLDQKYRELVASDLLSTKTDSIAGVYNIKPEKLIDYISATINKIDSSNMVRIGQIIKQYGYPGKSLVGIPTNESAASVIQHSKLIDEYLSVIQKAARNGELPFDVYAKMLDRSLMYHEKEQIYGTQLKGFYAVDPQTKKKTFINIVWPIKDPKDVNARRKKAGFKQTVEENAKGLGIEYKLLTLDEVKKMRNN